MHRSNTANIATIKGKEYLEDQIEAGKIFSDVMNQLIEKVQSQEFDSYLSLSRFAEEEILKYDAIPTFKNYKGFPEAVCISINNTLVHGIPKDIKPEPGDLVSLDFGVTINQSIVDAAITLSANPSQEDIELIEATKKCLYNSLKVCKPENRFNHISMQIENTAKELGYNIVDEMGGHGIGYGDPHDFPFISNSAQKDDGIRIQAGMTFAIEPLLFKGDKKISIDKDGWSVNMLGRCCHFEHTVHILEDTILVLTINSLDSITSEI